MTSAARSLLCALFCVPFAACGEGRTEQPAGSGPPASRFERAAPVVQSLGEEDAAESTAEDGLARSDGSLSLAPGETGSHDFGTVVEGRKLTHAYRLRSGDAGELVVNRLSTTCKCTRGRIFLLREGERVPYVFREPIPPSTEIEVEVDLSTHQRVGEWTSRVSLFFQGAGSPLSLHNRVKAKSMFDIEPRAALTLEPMLPGEERESSWRISSKHLGPFQLRLGSTGEGPAPEIELEPLEPDEQGRSAAWDVRLRAGPDMPPGQHSWIVNLETDQPVPWPKIPPRTGEPPKLYNVQLSVRLEVRELLTVRPRFLSFGKLESGATAQRKARIRCADEVELSADMSTEVRILEGAPELAERIRCTVQRLDEENAVELTLHLDGLPEGLQGSFEGVLEIGTGHPAQPTITLRFGGVCR